MSLLEEKRGIEKRRIWSHLLRLWFCSSELELRTGCRWESMCMWYCHVATPVRSCEFENKKCANSRPSSRAILADARTANWIWTIPTVAYVSTGWCLIWLDNNKRASSFFPKIQTVAEYRVRVSRAVELFLSSDFEFRGTKSQPYLLCYDWNVTKITFCRVLNTPKASNLLVGQICGTVLCHFDWYGASKTC